MDAQLKQKWVEALRSGKYKQARNVLHRVGGGLCCIGVGYVCKTGKRPDFNSTFQASQEIGLTVDQQDKLSGMNDYERRSFRTIADYIEREL